MHSFELNYEDQHQRFEAFASEKTSHPSSPLQRKPTLLIFHAWGGRDSFVCEKTKELAKLGYLGIAMDLYGQGVIGKNANDNQRLMAPLMEDRNRLRQRMQIGLNAVLQLPQVDSRKIGAIGYCFGGLCALDLARSGADIKGVVSFHGLLNAPQEGVREKIRSKILVCHGSNDPMVPKQQMIDFTNEMTERCADWQLHIYGHTVHAFTNPNAHDLDRGTVYNSVAEQRSWQAMQNFFDETF